jgi:alkylation response protein AidB-like acyl-CoA dehydrogenase
VHAVTVMVSYSYIKYYMHICFSIAIFSGLLGGTVIGLPPVLNFGSEALKARIVPDILAGKKVICLAVSEAHAGSDVLGLQTTAVKTKDGKEWIVNGTKKWITNGT